MHMHTMIDPKGKERYIVISSQEFMEAFFAKNSVNKDTILISITCPMDQPCNVKPTEHLHIFRMEFNDLDNPTDKFFAPDEQDFIGLSKFINTHKDIQNIFVHCGAGMSRSPAVAWSMADYLHLKTPFGDNFDTIAKTVYTPNMLVKRLCDNELNRKEG